MIMKQTFMAVASHSALSSLTEITLLEGKAMQDLSKDLARLLISINYFRGLIRFSTILDLYIYRSRFAVGSCFTRFFLPSWFNVPKVLSLSLHSRFYFYLRSNYIFVLNCLRLHILVQEIETHYEWMSVGRTDKRRSGALVGNRVPWHPVIGFRGTLKRETQEKIGKQS